MIYSQAANEAILAALQESEQILNDMPVGDSFAKSLET